MTSHFSIAFLLGAIGFFLYGLHMLEENLRHVAGDHLRTLASRLAANRVQAFLLGLFMTVILQSSTATTTMMVGLTTVGVLTLRQATSVVLGADVGTTVLVLVLASLAKLDTSSIAMGTLLIGFVATFLVRHGRMKFFAQATMGLGFLMYGLSLISAANAPLRESGLFRALLTAVAGNPPAALFLAALFTTLVQSSAAMIGILVSLGASGILGPMEAVPFILGANLGSPVMPFIVGLRSKGEGRRLGILHAGTKVLGVLIAFFFLRRLGLFAESLPLPVPYQLAAIHIVINVALAVVFLPFVPALTAWAQRTFTLPIQRKTSGSIYLDERVLDQPTVAFANVFREILRMAEITQEMVAKALVPFDDPGRDSMQKLEEMDDHVDMLDREIKFYLAKITQSQLTEDQSRRELELLMLTHGLESIGDVITKEILELAEKKKRKQVAFSGDGWNELKDFHAKVVENFQLAVSSFASGSEEIAQKVVRHKKYLGRLEQDLGQKHLLRLHQGHKESFDTSSIHLDILSNLRRINSIVAKMAYPAIDRRH